VSLSAARPAAAASERAMLRSAAASASSLDLAARSAAHACMQHFQLRHQDGTRCTVRHNCADLEVIGSGQGISRARNFWAKASTADKCKSVQRRPAKCSTSLVAAVFCSAVPSSCQLWPLLCGGNATGQICRCQRLPQPGCPHVKERRMAYSITCRFAQLP
jgi:hypothetical protein